MFIDLDRFKQINDTMGHRFGDILLQAVAERLESCIRGNDTVARLGGDEFAVLLQKLECASDADITAQRIVDSFRLPFKLLDREVFITASLGIAIYPSDEQDSCNLLAKADAAMYEAKTNGRNAFRVYRPGLTMPSTDHLSLEADLRQAIERKELVLHYQPQVNVASGATVGVEALVRWQHPQRGLLLPSAFIGIAEDSGMIIDIGKWVLREACRQQYAWSLCHVPSLRMAVNISAVQFRCDDFTHSVHTIIQDTEVDPGFIELELTENVAMHHADDILKTLLELKQIGVKLAIDDFGTGFSNLSYLQRFPFDRLKIDQSFVRNIEKLPANKSIVQAIVSLARSLSLEVVAEGVETSAEFAQTSACDEVQGYFHARPMPAADMLTWLSAPKYVSVDFLC
jgi:diguanylate cyclase (GGDEF)-like protein